MFTQIEINYANPNDLEDVYSVQFKLKDHAVAQKWANMVTIADKKYPIDDPGRFYGFYDKEELINQGMTKINSTIDIINSFKPIVDRHLENITDQDTLNYLHHIFEIYHGLLDSQTSDFWNTSPQSVKKALADLNIQVHECESIGRNATPTPANAVTWYNMPKVTKLRDDDYNLFEMGSRIGNIYLLYTEIGKTLEDLSFDNDQYIFETAFKPFRYISADFIVKYYNDIDLSKLESKINLMEKYYHRNEKFFTDRGLHWGHPYLSPGTISVAELISIPIDLIHNIKTRQWIKSINIT